MGIRRNLCAQNLYRPLFVLDSNCFPEPDSFWIENCVSLQRFLLGCITQYLFGTQKFEPIFLQFEIIYSFINFSLSSIVFQNTCGSNFFLDETYIRTIDIFASNNYRNPTFHSVFYLYCLPKYWGHLLFSIFFNASISSQTSFSDQQFLTFIFCQHIVLNVKFVRTKN